LSLLVEILGGILGGSSTIRQQPGNGLAFVVIDISAFLPQAEFAQLMREMRAYMKSSAPAPGHQEVLLPGEPDYARRAQRTRDGIPVEEALWEQIRAAAASVGVTRPEDAVAAQARS